MEIMNFSEKIKTAALRIAETQDPVGTYYWTLGSFDGNRWAICLGVTDGFEPDPNDKFMIGDDQHICVKLAYQPTNSLLQCDYDVDWLMPYDEETGTVDDNEECITENTDFDELTDRLYKMYLDYETKSLSKKMMAAVGA